MVGVGCGSTQRSAGFRGVAAVHPGPASLVEPGACLSGRVQFMAARQVALKLKTPWRDGTTHLVMSPLEFMQRLAALVPQPRLHLSRHHSLLAPNAKLRALVVPQEPHAPEQANEAASADPCEVETV